MCLLWLQYMMRTALTCSAPPVWPAAPVHQDSSSLSLLGRPLVLTTLHHGRMSLGWALGCPLTRDLGPCRKVKKGTPAEGETRKIPLSRDCCWVETWWQQWGDGGTSVCVRVVRGSSSVTAGHPSAWMLPDWPPDQLWSQTDQGSSNLLWIQEKKNCMKMADQCVHLYKSMARYQDICQGSMMNLQNMCRTIQTTSFRNNYLFDYVCKANCFDK